MQRYDDYIPERTRAQLLALGVPTANQERDRLANYFPRELNMRATGLDAEDVARVLVYLIEQGLVSRPGGGSITSVKKVAPGWHFCQFYHDFEQLLEMIAPYVAEGLRNNEGCLWVMPEAVTSESARHALAHHIDDVDGRIASGQLELLSHPSWYLDESRRLKSFEQIAGALIGRQDQALSRGFKFLRAAGDTGWISGTEESREFIDYEMKVNAAIGATKVAAICTYRADVTADELIAIVTSHQDALSHASAA
jgi:hypothetical protein